MSLLTIRTQIETELGGRSDQTTMLNAQINFAIEELATMFPFLELAQSATTTTADTQFEYLLPTDLYALWSVKEETLRNGLLEQKDIKNFDMIDETVTGSPSNWAQWGNSLILFNSVPDTNGGSQYLIRIRYWRMVSDLTAEGDNHLLPDSWERGIRLKATAFAMRILNMEEKADSRQQEFDRWLSRIKIPQSIAKQESKNARADMGSP